MDSLPPAPETAADPDRRRALRTGLRAALLASPLCNGPAYARALEAAYREMWRRR